MVQYRTCFSCGVAMKMVCTSLRMSSSASRRSHSSRMKCFTFERSRTYIPEYRIFKGNIICMLYSGGGKSQVAVVTTTMSSKTQQVG